MRLSLSLLVCAPCAFLIVLFIKYDIDCCIHEKLKCVFDQLTCTHSTNTQQWKQMNNPSDSAWDIRKTFESIELNDMLFYAMKNSSISRDSNWFGFVSSYFRFFCFQRISIAISSACFGIHHTIPCSSSLDSFVCFQFVYMCKTQFRLICIHMCSVFWLLVMLVSFTICRTIRNHLHIRWSFNLLQSSWLKTSLRFSQ